MEFKPIKYETAFTRFKSLDRQNYEQINNIEVSKKTVSTFQNNNNIF